MFGNGLYQPDTAEGRRLLAHELVHVKQQSGYNFNESTVVVQRQSANQQQQSSPMRPADPDFGEVEHEPTLRVHIIAHASPRWKNAPDADEADRHNLKLSERRGVSVKTAIQNLLSDNISTNASVILDDTINFDPIDIRGSHDTLEEAKGDRSDNSPQLRRVDIIIESNQLFTGRTGVSRPMMHRSPASKYWSVNTTAETSGSVGVSGGILYLDLKNYNTGETRRGRVYFVGGGPKAKLGASGSIWSGPTDFKTNKEIDFDAFEGRFVRYTSIGLSLGLGYSQAYLTFHGLGDGAKSINVSSPSLGWNLGIGGGIHEGFVLLDNPEKSDPIPIKGSDEQLIPTERNERESYVYKILFPTNSHTIDEKQEHDLEIFLRYILRSTQKFK